MKRLLFLLLLLPLLPATAADPAIRPNSLIFNQTYPLVAGEVTLQPLYLTRRGDYYAQAILERGEDGERSGSVPLDLNIQIDRNNNVVFERAVTTELGVDRPVATLFWLTSDRELPLKTPLTLALRVDDVPPAAAGETVRIQIKLKQNRSLRFR